MGAPHNILISPFEVWTAPVGTAFPEIDDDTPDSPWSLLGTGGVDDYLEGSAAEIVFEQDVVSVYSEGSTLVRKQARTQERVFIRVSSMDMVLETLTKAFAGDVPDVTTADTGTAGYKSIGVFRGTEVASTAVMVRGQSPYNNDLRMQYNLPVASQSGTVTISGQKGAPSATAFEWMGLKDSNASAPKYNIGELKTQTAAATDA